MKEARGAHMKKKKTKKKIKVNKGELIFGGKRFAEKQGGGESAWKGESRSRGYVLSNNKSKTKRRKRIYDKRARNLLKMGERNRSLGEKTRSPWGKKVKSLQKVQQGERKGKKVRLKGRERKLKKIKKKKRKNTEAYSSEKGRPTGVKRRERGRDYTHLEGCGL